MIFHQNLYNENIKEITNVLNVIEIEFHKDLCKEIKN